MSKRKKGKDVAIAVYHNDWRKIKKTKHVSRDKERMKRWQQMKNDDEILFGLYQVRRRTVNLIMESGATIVVGLGDTREKDSIITLIPPKNKWAFNRKDTIRGDWPIVEIK